MVDTGWFRGLPSFVTVRIRIRRDIFGIGIEAVVIGGLVTGIWYYMGGPQRSIWNVVGYFALTFSVAMLTSLTMRALKRFRDGRYRQ